MVCVFEDV